MGSMNYPLTDTNGEAGVQPCQVCCIFVLFHPQRSVEKTLEGIVSGGHPVVVVSNGADGALLNSLRAAAGIELIENSENLGLAHALNQGINRAFNDPKVQFVVLFDQDSSPPVNLPLGLANELDIDSDACVGPRLVDVKAQEAGYRTHNSKAGAEAVASIPTSGTVISRRAFATVGPMLEELFIDGIDHEWCLRAAANGFRVRISDRVTMLHDMGDDGLVWFGDYKPLYKNPIRHFYIIRNSMYLGLHGCLPLRWRLLELLKTLRRIPVYLWASNDRMRSVKLIMQALIDGSRGKLGPLALGR